MHSAFIRTADGWEVTSNLDRVLNHSGDAYINEDKDDVQANLAALAAAEGMYAELRHNRVILTKSPILRQGNYEAETIRAAVEKYGEVLTEYLGGGCWEHAEVTAGVSAWRHTELFGYVAKRKEDYMFIISKDEELWHKAKKVNTQKEKQQKQRAIRRHLTVNDLIGRCHRLGGALNVGELRCLAMGNFWSLVAAHDAVFGIRATNQQISDLAICWANNREKSKTWLAKWYGEETVKKHDARMMRAAPKRKIVKKTEKSTTAN